MRRGDVMWATLMIERKGVSVETRDEHGSSPLHHAAAHNQEEVLVALVALRADLQVSLTSSLPDRFAGASLPARCICQTDF
jgi:ankyrin repeat protein